jgi:DNA-binding PadR family transcriptional regulator
MKIQKVIFLLPSAVIKVSKRHGIPPLTNHEVFIIYAVSYLPMASYQMAIYRFAERLGYPISEPTISRSIHTLADYGLVTIDNYKFSITPLGREYLSGVRRYLLNKRL